MESILQKYINNFSLDDLSKNEHGKPELAGGTFSFNLSHSGSFYALLVCDQQFCGVDIQEIKEKHKFENALKSVLTDNEFSQLGSNGKNESFFQLWSLKEAFIKAIGSSIWFGRNYDFTDIILDYTDKWVSSNEIYFYSTLIFPETYITLAVPEKPADMKIINF